VKTFTPRTRTLIIVGFAVLALLLVATSLGQIKFAPGSPLPFQQMEPQIMEQETSDQLSRIMLAIMRVMMIAFWVLLPITLVLLLISKEARKRFLQYMMIVLPFIILLFLVTQRKGGQQQTETPEISFASTPDFSGALTPVPPMPEFQPPAPWVTTVTTLVLAVGITAVILITTWVIWRRSRQQSQPLARVKKEAQAALDAIQAGGDLRDVILRCYFQMVKAVGEYRNIRRSEDMTPHEFERILSSRGVPAMPVHDLTQVFEQVRYGAYRPGRQDERTAVASLSAIISACERMKDE
jgi:multisubunit Na+/H+ antiporter MnhC subunit